MMPKILKASLSDFTNGSQGFSSINLLKKKDMIFSDDKFSGVQPRQDLTKAQINNLYKSSFHPTPETAWYADNVRWVAQFFNINRKPFETNQNSYAGPVFFGFYGEADRAYRNFLYFQGDQSNLDFGWLTQIGGGGEMMAPWLPGKEINRFVKYIANKYLSIARNSKPVVKSYDYKAQSKLKRDIKLAMTRYDLKPFFDDLEKQLGVVYKPPGYQEMGDKKNIEKYFYQNPTTTAEIYGTELINSIRDKNRYVMTSFRDIINTICGGRSMIEVTKKNGWPSWEVIPAWCQISQGVEDDDFGMNDQCRGWVRSFTPGEVVSRQGLSGKTWGEQIVDKYGSTALEKVLQGDYNYFTAQVPSWSGWRFRWFTGTAAQIRTISVCRAYWKSLVDTRMLPHKDDPDNKIYYLSEKNKKKGEMVEVWRTATLIGNKYIVDEMICDEVRDPKDLGKLYCPLHVFQPYTFMGYSNSVVETVRAIQDDMSMLDFKFREMVGFDMGVVLSIQGSKVQGGTDAYALIEEIKKTRILNEQHTGDPDNPIDSRPTVTRTDFSTISLAVQYLDAWKRKEAQLKDTLNISDIALGTQKTYVGFDTQQATMDASSNNLQYLFYGHAQMMNNVLQYSLELMKIMIQSGETDAGDVVLGQRGVYFIKQMKKNLFSSLLCRTDVEDYIDENRRKTLMADLRVLMQTGQVDIVDLMKIEQLQTWSEIMSYVEWKYEQKKSEAEGQQLFDKIMQTVNVNRQAQAQESIAENQAMASMAMNQAKTEAKVMGDVLKYDAATSKGGGADLAAMMAAGGGGQAPMPMPMQGGQAPVPMG